MRAVSPTHIHLKTDWRDGIKSHVSLVQTVYIIPWQYEQIKQCQSISMDTTSSHTTISNIRNIPNFLHCLSWLPCSIISDWLHRQISIFSHLFLLEETIWQKNYSTIAFLASPYDQKISGFVPTGDLLSTKDKNCLSRDQGHCCCNSTK